MQMTKVIRFAAFLVGVLVLIGCSDSRPELPVKVTYRSSVVGEGYVAAFHNQSDKYLQVVVEFRNSTLNQSTSGQIDLPPNGTKEISWIEGWKFSSGETIHVRHDDYRPASYKIP